MAIEFYRICQQRGSELVEFRSYSHHIEGYGIPRPTSNMYKNGNRRRAESTQNKSVLVQSLVKIYSCLICHCYNSVSHRSKSVYLILINCNPLLRIPRTTYKNTASSSRSRIIMRDKWIHLDRNKSSPSFVPIAGIINRYIALMANKDDLRQRTMTGWFSQLRTVAIHHRPPPPRSRSSLF